VFNFERFMSARSGEARGERKQFRLGAFACEAQLCLVDAVVEDVGKPRSVSELHSCFLAVCLMHWPRVLSSQAKRAPRRIRSTLRCV
jgi:hypothetical protein